VLQIGAHVLGSSQRLVGMAGLSRLKKFEVQSQVIVTQLQIQIIIYLYMGN
jgi:predicted aspartyl protease